MFAAPPRLHRLRFQWIKFTLLDCVLWRRCWSLFRKRWKCQRKTTRPAAAGEPRTNYLSAGVTVGFVFMLLVTLRKKAASIKPAAVSKLQMLRLFYGIPVGVWWRTLGFFRKYLNSVVMKLFTLEFFTRNKPATQNDKVIQAMCFMIRCIRLYRSVYGPVFPVAVRRLAGSFYLIVSQRQ